MNNDEEIAKRIMAVEMMNDRTNHTAVPKPPIGRMLDAPGLPKRILINAHSLFRNSQRYRNAPLWSFIRDMTGHGCGYSIQIAQDCGWNPHQPAYMPLRD